MPMTEMLMETPMLQARILRPTHPVQHWVAAPLRGQHFLLSAHMLIHHDITFSCSFLYSILLVAQYTLAIPIGCTALPLHPQMWLCSARSERMNSARSE